MLVELVVYALRLVPALLMLALFLAQIIWQITRVFKAPNPLWRLNALALLGTTSLLFMPPYEGFESLNHGINVSLLPMPFILIACVVDPFPKKLLPIAHGLLTLLVFGILVTSTN